MCCGRDVRAYMQWATIRFFFYFLFGLTQQRPCKKKNKKKKKKLEKFLCHRLFGSI